MEQSTLTTNVRSYTVSEAQARTAAENIALSPGVVTQRLHNEQTHDTQPIFQGRQRIADFAALPAADGQPGLYLCNYVQGGFAIISADRHMDPVLAFAKQGSLPFNRLHDRDATPGGLAAWLETTLLITNALRQNPSGNAPRPGAMATWNTLVGNMQPATEVSANEPVKETDTMPSNSGRLAPPPSPPPCYSVQRGPFMQTTWGQNCGYNDYVTSSGLQAYCYHCPTGCVATAQAQVMYYWKAPASFNWSAMSPSSGTSATAHLMDDLGGKLRMNYTPTASGADPDYIDDALKGNYGYGSAEYISNQSGMVQAIQDNLRVDMPVILSGAPSVNWFGYQNASGHCWVTDGYIQSECDGSSYLAFYMNWGWDGQYNGWFNPYNWQVTWSDGSVHNYNCAQTYTYNIHP